MNLIIRYRPELIFMDHDMKGGRGLDLVRMLKSNDDLRTIPVIYFSGCDNIVELSKELGADGYFRKPFKTAQLIRLAQKYLDGG